jgi:hypothetical protein
MGMRELSTQMAEPFGDDDIDFPTDAWMHELVVMNTSLLEDQFEIGRIDPEGVLSKGRR